MDGDHAALALGGAVTVTQLTAAPAPADAEWPFDRMEVGHYVNTPGASGHSKITRVCPTVDGRHVKMIVAIKLPFRPGPEGAADVWLAYAPGAWLAAAP